MSSSLFERMRTVFGEKLFRTLLGVNDAARAQGLRCALVGGAVRDLLVGQNSADIDFLLQGDAIKFGKALAAAWRNRFPEDPAPTKPIAFARYGTLKLNFSAEIAPGVQSLDFASARAETYPVPGGAPVVEFADIESDLSRRDFTINAMAIDLESGELIDLHGGAADLDRRFLTVLHDRSFIDDPARLIRGARLASRLGFAFSDRTGDLFEQGIADRLLDTIPRKRLLDEFRKALEEKEPLRVLQTLERSGVLSQIDSRIDLSAVAPEALQRPAQWEARFRRLFPQLDNGAFQSVLEDFGVSRKEARRFVDEG